MAISLKKNIITSYISQIYSTAISIVILPLYLKYMGAEAYGLVGFFAMLQAWFQLLDIGLTPTLARETARFNGGASDSLSLRRLLRSMEGIFVGIAIVGLGLMIASSGAISKGWLKVQTLPLVEVQYSIILMAAIIALRWVSGLYRSAITGFERLIWLNNFSIAITTARFVLVVPMFIFISTNPTAFFTYQLVVASIETIVLMIETYRLLPVIDKNTHIPWQWAPIQKVLKFSLSIAFTGTAWLLITQTDKLILSKLLMLTEYGYFTLSVLVAGGVTVVSSPINGALLPRLTKLSAEHDDVGLIQTYRNATQLISVSAIPVVLVMVFYAEQLLWIWTGDAEIAHNSAPVMTLYAIGNGILSLAAFPYFLQYAKGDLRLHMIGNAIMLVLLIPSLIVATVNFGVLGAGYAWLLSNAVYFLVWVPKVHKRFAAGLHIKWLFKDIIPVLLSGAIMAFILVESLPMATGRWSLLAELFLIGIVIIIASSMASSFVLLQIRIALKLKSADQ